MTSHCASSTGAHTAAAPGTASSGISYPMDAEAETDATHPSTTSVSFNASTLPDILLSGTDHLTGVKAENKTLSSPLGDVKGKAAMVPGPLALGMSDPMDVDVDADTLPDGLLIFGSVRQSLDVDYDVDEGGSGSQARCLKSLQHLTDGSADDADFRSSGDTWRQSTHQDTRKCRAHHSMNVDANDGSSCRNQKLERRLPFHVPSRASGKEKHIYQGSRVVGRVRLPYREMEKSCAAVGDDERVESECEGKRTHDTGRRVSHSFRRYRHEEANRCKQERRQQRQQQHQHHPHQQQSQGFHQAPSDRSPGRYFQDYPSFHPSKQPHINAKFHSNQPSHRHLRHHSIDNPNYLPLGDPQPPQQDFKSSTHRNKFDPYYFEIPSTDWNSSSHDMSSKDTHCAFHYNPPRNTPTYLSSSQNIELHSTSPDHRHAGSKQSQFNTSIFSRSPSGIISNNRAEDMKDHPSSPHFTRKRSFDSFQEHSLDEYTASAVHGMGEDGGKDLDLFWDRDTKGRKKSNRAFGTDDLFSERNKRGLRQARAGRRSYRVQDGREVRRSSRDFRKEDEKAIFDTNKPTSTHHRDTKVVEPHHSPLRRRNHAFRTELDGERHHHPSQFQSNSLSPNALISTTGAHENQISITSGSHKRYEEVNINESGQPPTSILHVGNTKIPTTNPHHRNPIKQATPGSSSEIIAIQNDTPDIQVASNNIPKTALSPPLTLSTAIHHTCNMARATPTASATQAGPHPGFIEPAQAYIFQHRIEENLAKLGMTEARDDHVRLQGVAWIETAQKGLKLPIKTFIAACILFHKFRLVHHESEYLVADAAAACLFQACKIQDTHKKSKEILCAAYNMRMSAADQMTPDDPMFDIPSKNVLGLERLLLEASRFDFRIRDPTILTMKVALHVCGQARSVYYSAWHICRDLHRTWAPLKQTRGTIAIASVELAVRLADGDMEAVSEDNINYNRFSTTREEVVETIIDALDLYTHHRGQTIVGPKHDLETFISIRITYNQEMAAKNLARFTRQPAGDGSAALPSNSMKPINGSSSTKNGTSTPISPAEKTLSTATHSARSSAPPSAGNRGQNGTLRFMLDARRAREEEAIVEKYYKDEEEEYEIEVPSSEARIEKDREDRERDRNDSRRDDRGRGLANRR